LCHDPASLPDQGIGLATINIQEEESSTSVESRTHFTTSATSTEKGSDMKTTGLDALKVNICGKKIVSVEPSQWSGEVKSLTQNHDYISIKLDDGTILEIGSVYLHDGNKICDSHTNP
jgi:hypothetical protein